MDSLTGFLVNSSLFTESFLGSPSQLLRAFVLILLVFRAKDNNLLILLTLGFYFLLVEFTWFYFHNSAYGLAKGIVFSYKIVYSVAVLIFFYPFVKNEHRVRLLIKFVSLSLVFHSLLLLIPRVLGIGFHTYRVSSFGTKGFFASQNGLGIFMGTLILIALYCKKRYPDISLSWWQIVLALLALVFIGTKTSLILTLVASFFIFTSLEPSYKILIVGSVSLAFLFYWQTILTLFELMFDVVVWRYNNSPNIYKFIFSGRDNYVVDAFSTVDFANYPLRLVFGTGSFLSFRTPNRDTLVWDTLETDLFDIFFFYGLTGIVLYVGTILFGLVVALRARNKILISSWIFLSLHSVFAGHIIFSGFSSLALSLVFVFSKYEALNMERENTKMLQ